MSVLDYKENWAPKNWCFWIVVLKKTPESLLDCNQAVLKEISPGCSLEGVMLKPNSNTLATWREEFTHLKRPWCWEKLRAGGKGLAEDEMIEWHHQLNGHEFEEAPGVGCGQGSLVCCSPWGRKESDTTKQLNWSFNLAINLSCLCNVV